MPIEAERIRGYIGDARIEGSCNACYKYSVVVPSEPIFIINTTVGNVTLNYRLCVPCARKYREVLTNLLRAELNTHVKGKT